MNNTNINISSKNISGKCDLKCSYNFKYNESNSIAKNNGVMISLTYETNNSYSVTYNNIKYNVDTISIVCPSIHIFNGKKKEGEIIITHNPLNGGDILDVCIPLTLSSEPSNASKIIQDIIEKVSNNAPNEGETTNLNNLDFNLQNIVPRKPFYTYSKDRKDFIVFGELESISLNTSTLDKLKNIIKPYNILTPGDNLFYNSKGPTTGLQLGKGIYISCQPTGSTNEETSVEYDKNETTNIDIFDIFNSQIFKILIGCLIIFIVFFGISKFYSYLSPKINLNLKST